MRASNYPEASFLQQDQGFVAWVDGAFQDAARRSGPHLLCRPGCAQCCVGVFAIGPADALRIRYGLEQLDRQDAGRALQVRGRAAASWNRLVSKFPGDAVTGVLQVDEDGELPESFEGFANHEVCPALDPQAGTCDLYEARPHTCRVFGPPVATPEGYGVCELCFQGATSQEVTAAAIAPEPEDVSQTLDQAAIAAGAQPGNTVLAFVLSLPPS